MSANLLFPRPMRKLALAAIAALASSASIAPAARADGPENVRIEIWQGVQKLDVAEVLGLTGVPDNVRHLLPFTRWKEKENPVAYGLPIVLQTATWSHRLRTRLNSFPDMPIKAAAPVVLVPKPIAAAHAGTRIKDPKPSERDEPQEAKIQVAAKTPSPAPAPAPVPVPAQASAESMQFALLQVALVFSVAVIAPLVFVVSFFRLLGSHTRKFGPLFHVDGNQPIVAGPFSASALGLSEGSVSTDGTASVMPAGDRFKEQAPEHLPEKFELGPSYEEERLMKQRQAAQQEQAAVAKLIEDNLRFQEEIQEAREEKQI